MNEQVKAYVEAQWGKILAGRVSVADFVFAKEVRLGTYSGKPGAVAPPAAIVAAHAMAQDPRAEPRFGERMPYVVVHGPPGLALKTRQDKSLRLFQPAWLTRRLIHCLDHSPASFSHQLQGIELLG